MVRSPGPRRAAWRISAPSATASSSASSSRPGRQKRSAPMATAANTVVEIARWMPTGSPVAIATAAIAPPSTAPIDQIAWKELMIERP